MTNDVFGCSYYGWRGSYAFLDTQRYTRTSDGMLTNRVYRFRTMLSENGDIIAIGEVVTIPDGQLLRASKVIRRSDLLAAARRRDGRSVAARIAAFFEDECTCLDRWMEDAVQRSQSVA